MLSIGVTEGDVDAGKFLVLKNIANDALHTEIGADGELAHTVRVFIGMRVGPEIGFELLVEADAADDAVGGDFNGQGSGREQPVACAEPIAPTPSTTKRPFTSPGDVKHSPPGRLPHFSWEMIPEVLNHL